MTNDTTTWSRHPGSSPALCIDCGKLPPQKPRRICGPCRSARVQTAKKAELADGGGYLCTVQDCQEPRAGTPSQRRSMCATHYQEGRIARSRAAGVAPRRRGPEGVPDDSKWCYGCEEIKPLTEFCRSSGRSDGRKSQCKTCEYKGYLRRLEADPEKVRAQGNRSQRKHRRRRAYGITNEEFNAAVVAQGSRCPICKLVKTLVVDHDHQDGHIRGIICNPCNLALGLMQDDIDRLRTAADYLDANPGPSEF